jgi:hypothetical protein
LTVIGINETPLSGSRVGQQTHDETKQRYLFPTFYCERTKNLRESYRSNEGLPSRFQKLSLKQIGKIQHPNIYYCLFILTENGGLPHGSGTAIRHNAPCSKKT